jgi:hypothetical protein
MLEGAGLTQNAIFRAFYSASGEAKSGTEKLKVR